MKKMEILEALIPGLDPYESFGVPNPVWLVILKLCVDIYGQPGMDLLLAGHKIYESKVDANTTSTYHYFQLWRDGGNTEILPEQLNQELKALRPQKEPITMDKLPTAQVKEKIAGLRLRLHREQERHEKAVKKLKAAIFDIQENGCSHETCSFNPDPSGNNDSYYECDVCGRESRRRPCC